MEFNSHASIKQVNDNKNNKAHTCGDDLKQAKVGNIYNRKNHQHSHSCNLVHQKGAATKDSCPKTANRPVASAYVTWIYNPS
jgi:hypothetical protein